MKEFTQQEKLEDKINTPLPTKKGTILQQQVSNQATVTKLLK